MKAKLLLKTNLPVALRKLSEKYLIYVPVEADGIVKFERITSFGIKTDFKKTALPLKSILFPQAEMLFRFKRPKMEIECPELSFENTLIFGVKPCDATAVSIFDKVFDDAFKETYYLARRAKTTIVCIACNNPDFTCFCKTMGLGPHSTTCADVILTDINDGYYVEFLTPAGERVFDAICDLLEDTTEKMRDMKMRLKQAAEQQLQPMFDVEQLKKVFQDAKLFTSEYWAESARKCIGCGICTYLCPTCYCFDIFDTAEKRMRVWDSCQFPDFTMQASGHNPRSKKLHRIRNRFYHKFRYLPEKHNIIGCVGCGRCIHYCPVNFNILYHLQELCKNV